MKKAAPKPIAKAKPKVKPNLKVKAKPKAKPASASRPAPFPKTGGVNHVILTVNDLAKSKPFYAALMPRLGYTVTHEFADFLGWSCSSPRFSPGTAGGGSFWIKPAAPRHAGESFSKERVGLCEVAFSAENPAQVDSLARDLKSFGGRILDPPREYPQYGKGYYSVFFADPDGIKLELAHLPA